MNSILQCLSNTRELRDYCLQRLYMRDLSHSSSAHTALMEGEGPSLDTACFSTPPVLRSSHVLYVPLFLPFGFSLWGP